MTEAAQEAPAAAGKDPVDPDRVLSVTVGGQTYKIGRFRGLKAQAIMRETVAIADAYPEIAKQVGAFIQEYADAHLLRVSRPEAELRFGEAARKITEEAWATTDQAVPLKELPDPRKRLLAVWAKVYAAAEKPAERLLALISLSNAELEAADDEDDLEGAIAKRRRELLHNGYPEELVELAVAGWDVGRAQFGPLVDRAIPFAVMVGASLMTTGAPAPMASDTSPRTEADPSSESSAESSEPLSSGGMKASSVTASPPPTDGTETTSSSGRPGEPSEPSLAS